jgi:hypothetical protein
VNLSMETTGSADATTGTLVAGPRTFFTIELPYADNQPNVSCVPAGDYDLIPYTSPVHGRTWRLDNPALNVYGHGFVPEGGRFDVEIHSANFADQLLGCIAIGTDCQPLLNTENGCIEPAVDHSRDAVADLLQILGPLTYCHTLTITRH